MDYQKKISCKTILLYIGIAGLLIGNWGCSNNDTGVQLSSGEAGVVVFQGIPEGTEVSVRIGGKVMNSKPMPFFSYEGYGVIPAGRAQIIVSEGATELISREFTFSEKTHYSVIASGTIDNPTIRIFKDEMASGTAEQTKVRFIHIAPNAPDSLVVLNDATGNILLKNKYLSEETESTASYITVRSGLYDMRLRGEYAPGDTVSLRFNANLRDGAAITIFAGGLLEQPKPERAFGVSTYRHQ
jgi:hypothetical protein